MPGTWSTIDKEMGMKTRTTVYAVALALMALCIAGRAESGKPGDSTGSNAVLSAMAAANGQRAAVLPLRLDKGKALALLMSISGHGTNIVFNAVMMPLGFNAPARSIKVPCTREYDTYQKFTSYEGLNHASACTSTICVSKYVVPNY